MHEGRGAAGRAGGPGGGASAAGPARTRPSSRRRPCLRASALLLLAWLSGAAVDAAGQGEASTGQPLRLNPSVQQALSRLQDQWLLWNSSLLQGDSEQMIAAEEDLIRTASELGFQRMPDLAAVAMQRAVEAARSDSHDRAARALASAQRFDPSNRALGFARSRVYAEGGRPLAASWAALGGFGSLLFDEGARPTVWRNLMAWVAAALQVTGVLFLALLMAMKGSVLLRDLRIASGSFLPAAAAGLLGIALLAWPALLPAGWLWLSLLWAILLWGYATFSVRSVICLAVVSLTVLPAVVLLGHASLADETDPALAVIEDIERGALRGTFFEQLAELSRALPASVAVRHLTADVHQRLGQDDVARPLYAAVVDAESNNGPALNNLGLFHLVRGEYVPAIRFLQDAAEEGGSAAAAQYNLAASYDELLEFRSATRARDAGRSADPESFARWSDEDVPFVGVWGGLERGPEIRAELSGRSADRLDAADAWTALQRPLGVALLVILLGPLVRWLRAGRIGMRREPVAGRELWIERAARRLVPGAVAVDSGDGWRAFLELFVPVALLLAAMASRLQLLPLPIAQQPVYPLVQWTALLGAVGFLAFGWWRRG